MVDILLDIELDYDIPDNCLGWVGIKVRGKIVRVRTPDLKTPPVIIRAGNF
jgi:hypothetical protein